METKRFTRSFLIAITAFLVLVAGNAFAIDNKNSVVSPYWQVDSGSYTFIAVSHSSLSGMNSQIGVKVNALDKTGTAYATAVSFTVAAGNTQRVFIVPTNHTSVNSTLISTGKFLAGTSDFTFGHVRVDPVASNPEFKAGAVASGPLSQFSDNHGAGFLDATMLTYWGSVIIEANTTGFAMEFIGDMNDSTSTTGINAARMTSGVNLQ
ncbi:hypothetical protein UZ36_03485 [Candidatus Nitromaritima sp. SCGC AAA799-C22]|nr:hypothetical protein UZ36_03485 [Candidatus Nitromaritima sp. SCGC AAA799-C22]